MRVFEGPTNTVNTFDLDPEVRAYFTATGTRLKEPLWLRVETRWLANGTPIHITLFNYEEDGTPEIVFEHYGTIQDDLWEEAWTVDLPMERLDEIAGPIYLTFEVRINGVPNPTSSQTLMLHRTRFSS